MSILPNHPCGSAPADDALAACLATLEHEAAAARHVLPALNTVASLYPSWMASFDLVEAESVPLSTLLELLASAPTEFARGMVFGMFTARVREIARETVGAM